MRSTPDLPNLPSLDGLPNRCARLQSMLVSTSPAVYYLNTTAISLPNGFHENTERMRTLEVKECNVMHRMWVESGHSCLFGFIATGSPPDCRFQTADRNEAQLAPASSAPGPWPLAPCPLPVARCPWPFAGRRWATAFSILLFRETRKQSGFFPQEKATLHDFVTSTCESKML